MIEIEADMTGIPSSWVRTTSVAKPRIVLVIGDDDDLVDVVDYIIASED